MRIAIIGTGYVGLVTGSCLTEVGHHVVSIDNDERKIKFKPDTETISYFKERKRLRC